MVTAIRMLFNFFFKTGVFAGLTAAQSGKKAAFRFKFGAFVLFFAKKSELFLDLHKNEKYVKISNVFNMF